MTKPKIGIILSSTRKERFADRPAKWILDLATARNDADYEIVDLRDFDLPMFDAPLSPRYAPSDEAEVQRWSAKMASLDGFIFVTAEYNHSITGPLKNAMDFLYRETEKKPAAFLAYGSMGGARAVEHLRLIIAEQTMASVKSAVHIGMEPFLGLLQQGKDFADYPFLMQSATAMLDELAWWTKVLAAGRASDVAAQAAA